MSIQKGFSFFKRRNCPWNRKLRKEFQYISSSTLWTLILHNGIVRSGFTLEKEVLDEAPMIYLSFYFG